MAASILKIRLSIEKWHAGTLGRVEPERAGETHRTACFSVARWPESQKCENKPIKMMIGIGIPRSNSNIERIWSSVFLRVDSIVMVARRRLRL